jgi:hypothetical protein
VLIKNTQTIIGSIFGTVMLDNSFVPVEFLSAKCTNRFIELDTLNGSLNLYGICQPTISKIVFFEKQSFTQYPNPVESNLTLVSNLKLSSDISVDLFDSKGEKINSIYYSISFRESNIIEINSRSFMPGIYFWMIRNQISTFTGYFIKIK